MDDEKNIEEIMCNNKDCEYFECKFTEDIKKIIIEKEKLSQDYAIHNKKNGTVDYTCFL